MNLPKYYANVCEEMPPEYSDYENFEVKFGYAIILSSLFINVFHIDLRKVMRSLRRSAEESTQRYMRASTPATTRELLSRFLNQVTLPPSLIIHL
jgi:hypothetical protein